MNLRGSIYYPPNTLFSRLVLPFYQIKRLFQKVYDLILQAIWQELISGKTAEGELTNLVLFLLFCAFSLVIFYLQGYRHLLLIAFFLLWLVDRAIAQRYYLNAQKKVSVTLQITSEKLYLKTARPQAPPLELKFSCDQAKASAIVPTWLYSEGFQSEIKRVWQVFLYLENDTEILIDEENKPEKALAKANQLASLLDIPIIILSSEGNHDYAIEELGRINPKNQNTVKVKGNQKKWHISSQWRFQDSWQLLQKILQQSGFLLFVIVSGNFMVVFGGFVHSFLIGTLQPGFVYAGDWHQLKLDWESYLELFIAISTMISQGIMISQTKHIYLDQDSLKYQVNRQLEGHLKPHLIEAVLFIREPDPILLILGEKQGVLIENLPNPDTYRIMLQKIQAGLQSFLESDQLR